jgi:hypothetical protein
MENGRVDKRESSKKVHMMQMVDFAYIGPMPTPLEPPPPLP